MKKLLAFALFGVVVWILAGTPVQASEISKPGWTPAKHKKHHKKHKHHNKAQTPR